jgi:CheY-like chemotaxis protein
VPEAQASAPEDGTSTEATRGTVLVVDDDESARELMRRSLGREGFRVITAGRGEEALRLARETAPDAITLDVMMPGMDGWAVLAALKADAATADIPVVMVTIVDDRNLGYALGAADYLTKPIDRERLVAVLARHRPQLPILVVDDDPTLRELLRRTLEREGYDAGDDSARPDDAAHERLRAARRVEGPAGLARHSGGGGHRQGPHARRAAAAQWPGGAHPRQGRAGAEVRELVAASLARRRGAAPPGDRLPPDGR